MKLCYFEDFLIDCAINYLPYIFNFMLIELAVLDYVCLCEKSFRFGSQLQDLWSKTLGLAIFTPKPNLS